MTDQPARHIPSQHVGVVPHICIRDGRAAEAIDFYTAAFDATEVFRMAADDGKRLLYAHLRIRGGSLMLNDDFPEMMGGVPASPPACIVLHVQVDDADAAWAQAIAAGATERVPLADQFWGDRYGQMIDPFGHIWSIAAPVRKD